MATADQILRLVRSHVEGDDERLHAIALQIAATEAKRGREAKAESLRSAVDLERYLGRFLPPGGVSDEAVELTAELSQAEIAQAAREAVKQAVLDDAKYVPSSRLEGALTKRRVMRAEMDIGVIDLEELRERMRDLAPFLDRRERKAVCTNFNT